MFKVFALITSRKCVWQKCFRGSALEFSNQKVSFRRPESEGLLRSAEVSTKAPGHAELQIARNFVDLKSERLKCVRVGVCHLQLDKQFSRLITSKEKRWTSIQQCSGIFVLKGIQLRVQLRVVASNSTSFERERKHIRRSDSERACSTGSVQPVLLNRLCSSNSVSNRPCSTGSVACLASCMPGQTFEVGIFGTFEAGAFQPSSTADILMRLHIRLKIIWKSLETHWWIAEHWKRRPEIVGRDCLEPFRRSNTLAAQQKYLRK